MKKIVNAGESRKQQNDPSFSEPPARHPVWMSRERIERTIRVWSKATGRLITEPEAIQMLQNVRRLGQTIRRTFDIEAA